MFLFVRKCFPKHCWRMCPLCFRSRILELMFWAGAQADTISEKDPKDLPRGQPTAELGGLKLVKSYG